MKRYFIDRILREVDSNLPKDVIYLAHIYKGALILMIIQMPKSTLTPINSTYVITNQLVIFSWIISFQIENRTKTFNMKVK